MYLQSLSGVVSVWPQMVFKGALSRFVPRGTFFWRQTQQTGKDHRWLYLMTASFPLFVVAAPLQVQAPSVTITVLGNQKSVTLSDYQMVFTIRRSLFWTIKLSL